MKATITNPTSKLVPFADLDDGEVFYSSGLLYMKLAYPVTSSVTGNDCTGVRLKDGVPTKFYPHSTGRRVSGEFSGELT